MPMLGPQRVILPEKTTYLFVDGGHFRQYFNDLTKKWFGQEVEFDFNQIKTAFKAEKAFYYDCVDDIKKPGETQEDFDKRVSDQELKLNRIREVEGCHVFLGSMSGEGKKKRQKEVDVLLTVHMMEHAMRGNMHRAVLLSGDKDFRPLVESLVRLGLHIRVAGDKNHIAQDLIHSSDSHKKLGFNDYFGWTLKDHRKIKTIDFTLTSRTGDVLSHFRENHAFVLARTGSWNDNEIFIYQIIPQGEYFMVSPKLFRNKVYSHFDLEKICLYVELMYGEISWQ